MNGDFLIWCGSVLGLGLFIISGMGVSCYVVSYLSGWTTLATIYRHRGPFQGKRWRVQSVRLYSMISIGPVSQVPYSVKYNFLTVGANAKGLYLAIILPNHAPLFIPWSEITVGPAKKSGYYAVELHLQQAPTLRFRVGQRLAKQLAEEIDEMEWPQYIFE